MRAMIMAAGRGSRMRPLTDHTHKGLLEVTGQPLIEYHVKKLAVIGVSDIVINVSYLAKQIQNYLGNGEKYGVTIHYSFEDRPLEVGGGIIKALPLLGQDPFIVINCDVWCDYPLQNLPVELKNALGKIVLVNTPKHSEQGDFHLKADKVECIKAIHHNYTYAGIAFYHPELFSGFPQNVTQPMLPILKRAIAKEQLLGEYHQGQWFDVGTPERLAKLRCLQPILDL